MCTNVFSSITLFTYRVDDDDGILKFIYLYQNIMRIFAHSKAPSEK